MPECQNCESFVTADYARVFSKAEDGTVRVCPFCEDKIRDKHGEPRPARSTRDTGTDPTQYDHSHEAVTDGGEPDGE